MGKDIRVMLVKAVRYTSPDDVKNNKHLEVKTIKDNLQVLYKEIGCQYIDIPIRKIGGKKYCIVCDESGALVDEPIYTAICPHNPLASVPGNIIISGPADSMGDLTSLTNADIQNIVAHLSIMPNDDPESSFTPVIILG